MLLIGSHAMNYWTAGMSSIGVEQRKPVDTDYVGTYDEIVNFANVHRPKVNYPINSGRSVFMRTASGIVEHEVAWPDSRAERLIAFVEAQDDNAIVDGYIIPSFDVLYLLKLSHRYLKDSPAFLKTMRDIQMMRKLGAKIRPEHQEFYEQRMKDTYVNKSPSLNQSKAGFFDSGTTGVLQIYDHDSVHWAVKRMDKPAYESFKADAAEVMCSQELFERCTEEVKLLSVVEESMVLAIERSLSVYPGAMTPRAAFEYALSKCCTSIASGYWRCFAWENYDTVLNMLDENYYDKFLAKVAEGSVEYKT